MNSIEKLTALKSDLQSQLEHRLLPFWLNNTFDEKYGGFTGKINNNLEVDEFAPKAAVLNTRILWSFSAAFNFSGKKEYLNAAQRSFNYLRNHFIDKEFGGVYWLLDHKGNALNNRKQGYALSFAIYALAEYFLASQNQEALKLAIELFHAIENHYYDEESNGYDEAFSRNWQILEDVRLSEKDMNAPFTMNTHLHILEAYTKLFHVWKDPILEKQLSNLLDIHLNKIIDKNSFHLNLFFDTNWNSQKDIISYGHDIEAARLIHEAAKALGKNDRKIESLVISIAQLTLEEGIAADGSIVYEGNSKGVYDTDRHWWPQFEAMIGFMDAYQISGNKIYSDAVFKLWDFLKKHMQHPSGEWLWRVNNECQPNLSEDLVGPWKGPYHNTRALIEMINRINEF